MIMLVSRRGFPWTILTLALAAGCTESKTVPARRLLTTISKANKQLETASQSFSRVVSRRLDNKASDTDLKAAVTTFRAATRRVREDSEKWTIPKTPEAQALIDVFRANLDRRVEVIDELGPPIIETMANDILPNRQKAAKAREMFQDASKRIESETKALRHAEREYASSAGVFVYE